MPMATTGLDSQRVTFTSRPRLSRSRHPRATPEQRADWLLRPHNCYIFYCVIMEKSLARALHGVRAGLI